LGRGSTFSFILENKQIVSNDFDEKRNPIIIKSISVKTLIVRKNIQCCPSILVVDDEPFNIIALRALLKQ